MCLLAVLSRVHPDGPLVVGANRDELLARPAVVMERLAERPRVLGGRDLLAGGTWLAVNEHGVCAALTNQPAPAGRDPSRRSRGELPLLATAHASAKAAASSLVAAIDARDYNPCWLLVGDRESLHYLAIDASAGGVVADVALPPGLWVLENRPLGAPSPKAEAVRRALAPASSWRGEALWSGMAAVLRDHHVPPALLDEGPPEEPRRPREVEAACVHAGIYGTRSSAMVVVRSSPLMSPTLPEVRYSAGPPCTNDYRDAAAFW